MRPRCASCRESGSPHQREALGPRLGNHHAVERIAVVPRQIVQCEPMRGADIEQRKTSSLQLLAYDLRQRDVQFQLARGHA